MVLINSDKLEKASLQKSQLSSPTNLEQNTTSNLDMPKSKLSSLNILALVGVGVIIVIVIIGLVRWRYTSIQTPKNDSQSKKQEQNILDDKSGIDETNQIIHIEPKQTSKPNQVDESVDE